eukprot:CCRYP_007487-RA/>CCRYP_007487-RA protein AED:0.22 eAED:-0.23 QI:0/0/0/1/1/0.66/3/0/430
MKESIFQLEDVVVEDIQTISSPPSSSSTPAPSHRPSQNSSSPTPLSISTTSAPSHPPSRSSSTVLNGYFDKSIYDLEFATEYHISITIRGSSCKVGDAEYDFTNGQIKGIEDALAIGFCDKTNFPSGSCFTQIVTLMCKDATNLPKQFRGRKLADDTENNDLVITFVVSVVGQCANYDCRDGYEKMQAVGDGIKAYAAENLAALLTALKVANSTLFATASIPGIIMFYGDLKAPLLERYMKWYPKWGAAENTCSNDGQYEPYMESTQFIKDSLENCCNAYYSWAFNECMVLGGAETSKSTLAGFYVDYVSSSCTQSCFKKDSTANKNCGGIAPKWKETFAKAEECCSTKLFWIDQESCIARSTNTTLKDEDRGSKQWYVDWTLYKCVKDCSKGTGSNCGGLANPWDQMFETSAECCNAKLSWVKYSQCTA